MKKSSIILTIILPILLLNLALPLGANSILDSKSKISDLENTTDSQTKLDDTYGSFTTSEVPTGVTGTGAPLIANELGIRTDSFPDQTMTYLASGGQTSTVNLTVPIGGSWEGYQVVADMNNIVENRTWHQDSGFQGAALPATWSFGRAGAGGGSFDSTPMYEWLDDGHGSNDDAIHFYIDANDPDGPTYWFDANDRAYARQTLSIPRGNVVWAGIRMDYWAMTLDDTHYNMTGSFAIYVNIEGVRVWDLVFGDIQDEDIWYDTGLIQIPTFTNDQSIQFEVGLISTQSVGYEPDIEPHVRLDNVFLYVETEVSPENLNLELNNEAISGTTFGSGTATYFPSPTWTAGTAYANFSWTPSPNPPVPDLNILVSLDIDVSVYARRFNIETMNDTGLFTSGDTYTAVNASDIQWTTDHYVSVPNGYSPQFYFNVSIPQYRDITAVSQPKFRFVNLTSGWSYGDPGDSFLNVSVYQITLAEQNGFWRINGSSPNMISNLQIWSGSSWVETQTFRADEDTQFRALLPSTYQNDIVTFNVYDPDANLWDTLQATVDGSGIATTGFVNLGAFNASVGDWKVQAFVTDEISNTQIENVGYYTRGFSIEHSTQMDLRYPIDARGTWIHNTTYGEIVLLQLRINDSDNGDLLAGGTLSYSWAVESGTANDLGTGEYSIYLDTSSLVTSGQYSVSLTWTKANYDSQMDTFTLNVIFETDLFSSDAPGIDVPLGYFANLTVYYQNQLSQPISGASIACNWSLDSYTITPVGGSPGYYLISLETDAAPLGTYALQINASMPFHVSRVITLSVQVRELHTSAIRSSSFLSLPVGYSTSFTITYTDTDHDLPMTGLASAISCNWSDIHQTGDLNYTIIETATSGEYEVTLYSVDTDVLQSYAVIFNVERYGTQNHTFTVTVELRTHLTSFYLVNPIDPTPYTGDIIINVTYYDIDTDSGIENGSATGYNVLIDIESSTLPSVIFSVSNGTNPGEYIITILADQWGSLGTKDLTIYANWTGPTVKYSNETISTEVIISETPTSLFISEHPITTQYYENITFSLIYFDLGNVSGVVNGTGPYAGNVHLTIIVVTPGESIQQSDMVISEVDYVGTPGEYRIEFNTSYLSGLGDVEFRIWLNYTSGVLPYYGNQTILITVSTTYRQTIVEWDPLPVTPYDELLNLSLSYIDFLSGNPIHNDPSLSITITEAIIYTLFYDGDATGIFKLELDTSSWTPGTYIFHVNVEWSGIPYYQNRTSISVPITVRERHTDLTHESYSQVQYGNNLTLTFTYRDLDDFTSVGMDGGTFSLDASLADYFDVTDNTDGTYLLELRTDGFGSTGTFLVNVSMVYGGSRFCEDASDFFYLTVVIRRTQFTSELPDLAPYLTNASIMIYYFDDNNGTGITGANIFASCATSIQELQQNLNYWIDDLGTGYYEIQISTIALGTFGEYSIQVTANWTGAPFYQERVRSIDIEVSRRPASLTVSKSPLNTPFMNNVTFEITATDSLDGSDIVIDKSVLILTHGMGKPIQNAEYSITGSNGVYVLSINSTILSSDLVSEHGIFVQLFWGNNVPYYSNATASTEVSITNRFTSALVVSTPPAFYYFNISIILEFTDYATGSPIIGADVTLDCDNATVFEKWILDNSDGTYSVLVNTSTLPSIGKYLFTANISWVGSPYYQNLTGISFSVNVNPVSTTLNFEIPSGVTYYLGDIVYANITYQTIFGEVGIDTDDVYTNWQELYGTSAVIAKVSDGIYSLTISTSGLNAQLYTFSVNASKYLHVNRTITADVLLAAIPVEVDLVVSPTDPTWGDILTLQANITEARIGSPITSGDVNASIGGTTYSMSHIGSGIYEVIVSTKDTVSGERTITISFALINHESREKDFQIRISKIQSAISASLNPQVAVNGQNITLSVDYFILSNSSAIDSGVISYSWIDVGSGQINWNVIQSNYTGEILISNADVGIHQILVQAASVNYKTVSTLVTIEIREATTQLKEHDDKTVLTVTAGDMINITVYLSNLDLDIPVEGALLTYSHPDVTGNLTEIGEGYYTAILTALDFETRDHTFTISSFAEGYTPSTLQITVSIQKIPTDLLIIGDALIEAVYGENATFRVQFYDTYNSIGIANGTATYSIGDIDGQLLDEGGGNYSFTISTTIVTPGPVAKDITITLQKDLYEFGYSGVKLRVIPIPTQVMHENRIGPISEDVAVLDDYTHYFNFFVYGTNTTINDGTGVAIWEFGTVPLTPIENGSYAFGPQETELYELPVGKYRIRISLSRENFSRSELVFNLEIRKIHTHLIIAEPPTPIYRDQIFVVEVVFWDDDHNVPIEGAINTTAGTPVPKHPESTGYEDGTYIFAYVPESPGVKSIEFFFDKQPYYFNATGSVVIVVTLTDEQLAIGNTIQIMSFLITGGIIAAGLWTRVFSIPKSIRHMNRMIKMLRKGQIPPPGSYPDRRSTILLMMNEELLPMSITKTLDDVSVSTVDVTALDTEALLEELAVIVGLTEDDVGVLRRDLDQMRPSERAGFISEVIRQEKARRAKELAEARDVELERVPDVEVEVKLTEDEIDELRRRFLQMGISPDEVEVMIEQARNLSKAEVDALIEQLGGDSE